MHNKIHRRDHVIVNDDAIERLKFRLCFFDDLNIGDDLGDDVSLGLFYMFVSCSISLCVKSIFADSKFSLMCAGLNDMGIVITRGWDMSHASAI